MSNYIDGSFFVPYFTCYFSFYFIKNEASLYCFVCMECCQGSSRVPVTTVLLPESECKGRAFFRTAKLLQKKFSKKIKHFLNIAHFQSVIKSTKIREKRGVLKPYSFGLKIRPHIRHEKSAKTVLFHHLLFHFAALPYPSPCFLFKTS